MPTDDVILERLPTFAGFVQSDQPLPPLVIRLNGIEQDWVEQKDGSDPFAPVHLRNTTYWRFRCDVTAVMSDDHRAVTLEVFAGERLVDRRFYRCDFAFDRTAAGRPLVYLLHIPKTAGTSLREAIARVPKLRMLFVYHDPRYLMFEQMKTFSRDALDDMDVVCGHFPYGAHNCSSRRFKYISILRDPASFMKSYYIFQKYDYKTDSYVQTATIYDAIDTFRDPHFDNCFTRFLSGNLSEPVTEADLERAIGNIERDFAFVGHAKDMPGTMESIGGYLGVRLDVLSENVAVPVPEAATIDVEALAERYPSRIAFDRRLCAFVEERFGASSPRYLRPVSRKSPPAPPPPERARFRSWLRR